MKNKKGMEKPIEIFVALFVILAVALLVLQLFQDQLGGVTTQLDEEEWKARQDTLMSRAMNHCRSRCPSTCTEQNLARFCLSYGNSALADDYEFLDLNLDQEMGSDNQFLGGIYVCEDQVPCHALIDTCCGRTIDHMVCAEILDSYWDDVFGGDPWPLDLIKAGECDSTNDDNHWYRRAGFHNW